MPKRNHKAKFTPVRAAAPQEGPAQNGLKAFHAGKYTEAIQHWTVPAAELTPGRRAALAEAYFRRALATTSSSSSETGTADLEQAIELLPDESRFWYHLGLVNHRVGRLDKAQRAYARAAELGVNHARLNFLRALVEIELKPKRSLDDIPWITAATRPVFEPFAALLRADPAAALSFLWRKTEAQDGPYDPALRLMRGLATLGTGDAGGALPLFTSPDGRKLPRDAEAARSVYRGIAVAVTGRIKDATTIWLEASGAATQSHSALLPRLDALLMWSLPHVLGELVNDGRWSEALAQARKALPALPGSTYLESVVLTATGHLADAACAAKDWKTAATRWEEMCVLLRDGYSRALLTPIIRNLAIIYEALERWEDAGAAWEAVLKAEPRRGSKAAIEADAAGGTPPVVKQAWLRRRIFANYVRADRPDMAITQYKQAIKLDPDDLELRLELAGALHANDQIVAARNELHRILEKDAGNIRALLQLATVHYERDEFHELEDTLLRVLTLAPTHDAAKEMMSKLYSVRGVDSYNIGDYRGAKSMYERALQYTPHRPKLLVDLGDTELRLGNRAAGAAHFESAMANNDPAALASVFQSWLYEHDEPEALKVIARVDALPTPIPRLYIDLGLISLEYLKSRANSAARQRRTGKDTGPVWEKRAHELIDKGFRMTEDPSAALEQIMAALGTMHEITDEFIRLTVELHPTNPVGHLLLAGLYLSDANVKAAFDCLATAERLARSQGNASVLDEIKFYRETLGFDPSPQSGKRNRIRY